MADHARQTPEYFQAGLNAREMAHIYHDSERDTKYYVQHGKLPQELVIPAWDHLAIGEPQGEPKHEDFAPTAPETNNNSPGTPRRPVPALKNSANPPSAADPKGPRSNTELQDLRNISDSARQPETSCGSRGS
ncbi:hypothetical protein D6C85_07414 [Aureobasidium pullulans]|uniref:Uncharacterized protein n=1 Tax=Aureobasidium pullulans TaxID=5580 RepID=A0A4S9WRP0_AURPU|nr:hypothetical protein D6C85_07414 [Aureobasidium pullulans]